MELSYNRFRIPQRNGNLHVLLYYAQHATGMSIFYQPFYEICDKQPTHNLDPIDIVSLTSKYKLISSRQQI